MGGSLSRPIPKWWPRPTGLVLPGVGAFAPAWPCCTPDGLIDAMTEAVKARGFRSWASAWACNCSATGPGVRRDAGPGLDRRRREEDRAGKPRLKVPHMGWNALSKAEDHPSHAGIPRVGTFYSHIPILLERQGPVRRHCLDPTMVRGRCGRVAAIMWPDAGFTLRRARLLASPFSAMRCGIPWRPWISIPRFRPEGAGQCVRTCSTATWTKAHWCSTPARATRLNSSPRPASTGCTWRSERRHRGPQRSNTEAESTRILTSVVDPGAAGRRGAHL